MMHSMVLTDVKGTTIWIYTKYESMIEPWWDIHFISTVHRKEEKKKEEEEK